MPLSVNVSTGLVKGRFGSGVVAGPNGEKLLVPARGRIDFEPVAPYVPYPTGTPSAFTILRKVITGILDSEGYLCTPHPDYPDVPGVRGLELYSPDDPQAGVQGWTWRGTPRFVNADGTRLHNTMEPFTFDLPYGEEVDLVNVVDMPQSPGIGKEQAIILAASAQAAATSAAGSAEAAAEAARKIEGALPSKADLIDGKVPVDQLPPAVGVTDEVVAPLVDMPETAAKIDARVAEQVAGKLDADTAAETFQTKTDAEQTAEALTAAVAEAKAAADATYAPLTSLPQTVRHGGEASIARTTTGQITWVGWVQPANMETQDVWLEIGQPAFNIKTSIDWEALYLASDLTAADGASVPVWADASGHGHNLTPAISIGAGTPTLKRAATEFNGKPAVAFNASAMWSEVLSQPVSQPFTVVAVARGLANPTGIFGGPAIIYRASAAPGHYTFNPGNGAREISGSAGTDVKLLMVEFDGSTSTGRANTLTTLEGTPFGTMAHQAAQIKVGGHDAGASKQSEIAMVGMYRGKLTAKQRTDLFAWVTAQYGITL